MREALTAKRSWEGREQCVRRGWWRATGPVQVPTGQHLPLYLVRSERREAKTDAGHDGAWLCGCGWSDAGDVRAYGEGRRGRRGWATHLVHIGELRKAEETKSRVLTRDRII